MQPETHKRRFAHMSATEDRETNTGYGSRIRQIRGGKSLTEFAAGFGIHKNTLARYEKGESMPDVEFLSKLCDIYRINAEWILNGIEPMHKQDSNSSPMALVEQSGLDPELYVYIPLYNVVASGGDGAFPGDEEIVDALAFKREWVRSELRANPKDLALVMMTGESMEPTLSKDDVILVNRRIGSTHSDGIYLLRAGEALLVKRLQFMPQGSIRVISDNQAYEPFTVTPDTAENDFRIIGRVVWVGKKF
jgi:phage repressor protein C with HTH and peptisase S24 domain